MHRCSVVYMDMYVRIGGISCENVFFGVWCLFGNASSYFVKQTNAKRKMKF